MKRTAIYAALGLLLLSAPAYAGGKNGLSINANVSTGKGGVLGTLLGGGKNAIKVDANVKTGKGGLLGTILGGLGGHGCGCH